MTRGLSNSDVNRLILAGLDGCLDEAISAIQYFNVDVNASVSVNPLRLACLMGNYDMAKFLLDSGANVHTTAGNLLVEAIASPADEETKGKFVELLLSKGTDINLTNQAGDSALATAVRSNYTEVVKLLLQRGARVVDAVDNTPVFDLEYMCERGYIPMLEILLEALPREAWTRDDWVGTPLCAAVYTHECDLDAKKRMIKLFVDHGVDINIEDEEGNTALLTACGYDEDVKNFNPELVSFLLEVGADVHAVSEEDSRTALHAICATDLYVLEDEDEFGEEEREKDARALLDCVKVLLQHGANVDVFDDDECSPLELAVQSGKSEVADLLLAHKKPKLPKYF